MIKLKKIAGIYAIIVGCSIILVWIFMLLTNNVPELSTNPTSIYFHIVAEVVMAIMLLVSGFGMLNKYKWSVNLYILSSGLLIYSLINVSGYYVNKDNLAMIIIFLISLITTLVVLRKLLKEIE